MSKMNKIMGDFRDTKKMSWKLINNFVDKKGEKKSYTRSYTHYPQKSGEIFGFT